MDFSTINIETVLKKFPAYKLPPTYRLQRGTGNGCFGDPPGYPTYFTKAVYNSVGNCPHNAPQYVIQYNGVLYAVVGKDLPYEKWSAVYRRLYTSFPVEHPRVRLWINQTYRHFHGCYYNAGKPGSDKTIIWPVPDYKLKTFMDDSRFSDDWRKKERAAVEQENAEITEYARKICTPENHEAVRRIREIYPAYTPELDLIENPPKENIPNWWETEEHAPANADECTEQLKARYGDPWQWKHPVNGSWCQWCGQKKEGGIK